MINSDNHSNIILIKKAQLWLGFFVLIMVLSSCKKQDQLYAITGNTMGTTYSIKIIDKLPQHIDINNVKSSIDSFLQVVNQQMSTYVPDSEISRFNNLNNNEWFTISNEFYDVIVMAQEMSRLTNGAFDITVGPMVGLWGFSKDLKQDSWKPPAQKDIKEIIKFIGFNNIAVGKNAIKKVNPDAKIDLNAIAKGYGVDVVFDLLNRLGYTDILVEIGGEVRCSGHNKDSESWRIGIDRPILDVLPGAEIQAVISLDNKALATSGDYRNYFIYNGELFSHTVDPETGYPTQNNVASASVIASNCMTADALATALMVMGKDGIELINTIDGVEAMIIIRTDENSFNSIKSFRWGKN